MAKPNEFTDTRIIIAEGYDDSIFTERLVRTPARKIGPFEIWANEDLGSVGGNTGFRAAIAAADIKRGFSDVTHVVILADNDDSPAQSFSDICGQIRDAERTRNWAVPMQPGIIEAGNPSVAIWMFPSPGALGCLETLLWEAIKNQKGNAANVKCVEDALKCSGANQWSKSKQDKARVRIYLSLVCKKNPSVSFNNLWRDFPSLIPMNQAAFTPFANFLRTI
jgi:hypothetical protein